MKVYNNVFQSVNIRAMTKFFCADAARRSGEDKVGTATSYQTYVLVECPSPWQGEAFETATIPENLRSLIGEFKSLGRSVRFLLIAQRHPSTAFSKVIIYDRSNSHNFQKYELNVTTLEQVAGAVEHYFAGNRLDFDRSSSRDILICTHGSHDQCCARYGNPFYMQAMSIVQELGLTDVRVWKSSHFGGHRFAPTAIAFPDGRYYGGLDGAALRSILTRTGNVADLRRVYRGLSGLPPELQGLERDLWLQHGWEWLNDQISYRRLQRDPEQKRITAELIRQDTSGAETVYRAEIAIDPERTICNKGSCGAAKESTFVKYTVVQIQVLQPVLSH
jgi:hypothetical protein